MNVKVKVASLSEFRIILGASLPWSQRTTGAVAGDCCAGKNQKKRLELHAFLLTVRKPE